jgi:hypothetical protein
MLLCSSVSAVASAIKYFSSNSGEIYSTSSVTNGLTLMVVCNLLYIFSNFSAVFESIMWSSFIMIVLVGFHLASSSNISRSAILFIKRSFFAETSLDTLNAGVSKNHSSFIRENND